MNQRRITVWLCLGMLGTVGAACQTGSGAMHSSQPAQNDEVAGPAADRNFVKKAMDAAMAELQMSRSAETKSANEDVKKFAQTVVSDRSDTLDELRQAAQQMNLEPPSQMSGNAEKNYTKLNALSGAEFDDAYMKTMVKMHKDDDRLYREEAKNTTSPQLKQMMTEADGKVQDRLKQAQPIADAVSNKGRKS